MKPEKVTVIRYVRPFDKKWKISNLGGVTFVFDLDYVTKNVAVSMAVCSKKDNFNKKKGVEQAKANGPLVSFPLNSFQEFANEKGGFVDAAWKVLEANMVWTGGIVDPVVKKFLTTYKYEDHREG